MKLRLLLLCFVIYIVKSGNSFDEREISVKFDDGELVVEWPQVTELKYLQSYAIDVKIADTSDEQFGLREISIFVKATNASHYIYRFKDIHYYPATVYRVTVKGFTKDRSFYSLSSMDYVTKPLTPEVAILTNTCSKACSIDFEIENAQGRNSNQYIFAIKEFELDYILKSIKENRSLDELGLLNKQEFKNGVMNTEFNGSILCDSSISIIFTNMFYSEVSYKVIILPKQNCEEGSYTGLIVAFSILLIGTLVIFGVILYHCLRKRWDQQIPIASAEPLYTSRNSTEDDNFEDEDLPPINVKPATRRRNSRVVF